MELWGVVYQVVTDSCLATCYLCDWRAHPVDHDWQAAPMLADHLHEQRHQDLVRQVRGLLLDSGAAAWRGRVPPAPPSGVDGRGGAG